MRTTPRGNSLLRLVTLAALTWPFAVSVTWAQEGEGGSIGGSISTPASPAARPARAPAMVRHRPAPRVSETHGRARPEPRYQVRAEPREAPPARRVVERRARGVGGGSGASFDGAWGVSVSGSCASGNSQVMISGGHITGQSLSGSVSPSGVVHTVGVSEGMVSRGIGHLSGGAGSGTFQRADGCGGSWSAYRM